MGCGQRVALGETDFAPGGACSGDRHRPGPGSTMRRYGAETIAVIAHADLAVLDLELGTLDGAGLGDLLLDDLFSSGAADRARLR